MQESLKISNDANMQLSYIRILNTLYNQLKKDCEDLDLFGFKGIKIVNDDLLNSSSDGNSKDKLILLPKNKTKRYIDDRKYDVIKSTIYHELCHIDLANKLPHLHSLHKKYVESEDYIKCFTIMIYVEYLAHLKSTKYESIENIEKFFYSINDRKWDFNNDCDCVWFIKAAPYVISRALDNRCMDKDYVQLINNEDLKKHILEIKEIFCSLPSENLKDDMNILEKLENYVSNYIKNY